ncbi:MAG: tetratricopeptide repeat protein [Myxococcales bacterium]|nr:tetratricopeptide repeat protein [Myxococcales bacterium]MCB9643643.1 tetratricopeptide repeat protein [Myxococcales bacterium]
MTRSLGFLLGISFFALLGCTPSVTTYSVEPPRLAMPGVKRIAILPFRPYRWGGNSGMFLAELISQRLSGDPNVQRLFVVIDINAVPPEMRQQTIQREFSDAELIQGMQRNAPQVLLTGAIVGRVFRNRRYLKEVQVTRDGETYNTKVECLSRTMRIDALMRIVRTSDQAVLHSVNGSASASDDRCGKDISSIMRRSEMRSNILRQISDQFSDPLSPAVRRLSLPLEKDEKEKRLEAGIEFAQRGRWSRAVELWRDALRNDPANYKAIYNLGVAAEVQGRLQRALAFYHRAEKIYPKDWYLEAIRRVETRIRDRRVLRNLEKAGISGEKR